MQKYARGQSHMFFVSTLIFLKIKKKGFVDLFKKVQNAMGGKIGTNKNMGAKLE
jgi:hypothetical protein